MCVLSEFKVTWNWLDLHHKVFVLEVEKSDPKRYLGRGFFTKNSKFRKIFWYTHQMIMKVGAFESPDQGGPSRYPEHMSSTPRKFFTAPWSRWISQNWTHLENGCWMRFWNFSFFDEKIQIFLTISKCFKKWSRTF